MGSSVKLLLADNDPDRLSTWCDCFVSAGFVGDRPDAQKGSTILRRESDGAELHIISDRDKLNESVVDNSFQIALISDGINSIGNGPSGTEHAILMLLQSKPDCHVVLIKNNPYSKILELDMQLAALNSIDGDRPCSIDGFQQAGRVSITGPSVGENNGIIYKITGIHIPPSKPLRKRRKILGAKPTSPGS